VAEQVPSVSKGTIRPERAKAGGGTPVGKSVEGGTNLTNAFFDETPLVRRRELILVHKDDLEDIREMESVHIKQWGVGGFLCSAAISLAIDEALRLQTLAWAPKFGWCIGLLVAGLIFCYFGYEQYKIKHNKLTKIIAQTNPGGTPTT
jgi:hypothetical protein